MAKLDDYRGKRDFDATPEPGGAGGGADSGRGIFVIHKHAASHLHYDLRLEQDGVLRSWALPKGPSLRPGEKRLAVAVEDHPLDYAGFEGVIPADQYGGGTVMLWDRGYWQPEGKKKKDRLDFSLDGEKLTGEWTLARMGGRAGDSGKNWLLIKRRDGGEVRGPGGEEDKSVASGRNMDEIAAAVSPSQPHTLAGARQQALPGRPRPQLPESVTQVPGGEGWLHEIKFDGYRIMARVDGGQARLLSRNGKDWTTRFPAIAKGLQDLPLEQALLDGEVVALREDGISRFADLQKALSAGHTGRLIYQLFDLLHLDGWDLTGVALTGRKQALAHLLDKEDVSTRLRYTDHVPGRGTDFYRKAAQMGLEGVVSKRTDSGYRAGRSRQWRKTKCIQDGEFVVGGYTEPGGSREGFGSLLLGAYNANDAFVYTGRVGTGFDADDIEGLHSALRERELDRRPFHRPVPDDADACWVRPDMVVEVAYAERTAEGRLRHPSYRGVREDRDAAAIRLQSSSPPQYGPGPGRGRRARGGGQGAKVRLSHSGRVLYPEQGITKRDLAQYYETIQDWILPAIAGRPLSLVRCPRGQDSQCFYQKHPHEAIPDSIPRTEIAEEEGSDTYLYVRKTADLVGLVQAGALELHPWGCRVDKIERPDLIVFDLDPGPEVGWADVVKAARGLRERLRHLGLTPFLRTTGGKGLHLVVPLIRRSDWDGAKAFARAVCQMHAREAPRRFTTQTSKDRRRGRIFLDYLRNGRGATAIASYSPRARSGAPVAVPLRWDELEGLSGADDYHIGNVPRRLAALDGDPWAGFAEARRRITKRMRAAVGLEK